MKNIIIVDKRGNSFGEETLENSIQKKLIRRVARIFVFNSQGELFLQQRSTKVRAWPGRWDNSAGGFLDPGETIAQAARRELQEELGIKEVILKKRFDLYNEEKDLGRIVFINFETIFTVIYDGAIRPDREEVAGGRGITLEKLNKEMKQNPRSFSPGFVNAFQRYQKDLKRKQR